MELLVLVVISQSFNHEPKEDVPDTNALEICAERAVELVLFGFGIPQPELRAALRHHTPAPPHPTHTTHTITHTVHKL
ncbi:unnamed protein product, partial [Iphiclides podalirius]